MPALSSDSIDKCGSADAPVSAQAGALPAEPYPNQLVQLLGTPSLSLGEVALNSQAVFAARVRRGQH